MYCQRQEQYKFFLGEFFKVFEAMFSSLSSGEKYGKQEFFTVLSSLGCNSCQVPLSV